MAKKMKVREADDGVYEVQSPSGNTYIVTYGGSGDGDPEYMALWSCTCPAAQYGRGVDDNGLCKHMRAVIAMVERQI